MANTVKVNIEADASGAIRATGKTVEGLDNVSKSAKKAAETTKKANEDISKSSQGSAMQVTQLNKVLGAMGIPTGKITAGVNAFKAMTAGTNALRISLLALPFVAIAAAVMALFKAFSSTQEGADRLNAIMQPLKATLAVLWGAVQQLSIGIVDAFSNPRQAVINLWEVIKQNLINRFTAIPKLFQSGFTVMIKGAQAAAAAVRGIWSKSAREEAKQLFKEAKEAGEDYANAVIQLTTGIEDGISKTKGAYKALNEEVQRGIDIGNRLAELEKELEQARIDSTVPLARMRREYEELNTIARNTALSEEERIKAARQAQEVFTQMTAEQQKMLDLEIERLQLAQSLNATSREEELQLQQLLAQREELVARQEAGTRRLVLTEQQLLQQVQDRIEAEEQANIAYLESLELRAQQAREAEELANIAYLESLELRAEKFRDMLLTEEELRQRDIEAQIESLEYLLERKIITTEEAEAIMAQIRGQYLEQKEDAEQSQHEAEMARIKAQQEAFSRATGEAIAAGIARAKSAKEFGQEIIRSLAREAGAAAATSVFKALPFPANVLLAPIAGAAAERLISSFAGSGGGRSGGGGGGSIASLRGGGVGLNANQQSAIGSASAGRGGSQSVALDTSGFNEAVSNFPTSIKVELDLVETTRKINDQNKINAERDIDVR